MYIAIEGIKGCGKSTILKNIFRDNKSRLVNVCHYPITAPMAANHHLERELKLNKHYQNNDDFIEKLFLTRAYRNQPKSVWPTVIGDRSLATAIVTRWDKWQDPYYTISKVQKDYSLIIKPDVIVFIDTPIPSAETNISKRNARLTGMLDEKPGLLRKADDIYKELFQGGTYKKYFGKTQLIDVSYTINMEEMCSEILSIIKYYHYE